MKKNKLLNFALFLIIPILLFATINTKITKIETNILLEDKKNFSSFSDALDNMTGTFAYSPPMFAGDYILQTRIPTTYSKIITNPKKESLYPERYEKLDTIKLLIEQWAYRSLYNYRTFIQYQNSKDGALKDLEEFYINKFNFTKTDAKKYAKYSLNDTIASHFNVNKYSIEHRKYDKLRKYLLLNKPIKDIEPLLIGSWQNPKEKSYALEDTEPMIFYALFHPKLLKFLLQKGADVNITNTFGKNALMYAAQYNLYESAKILINNNIDINKGTIKVEDSYEILIETYNKTALHYAAENSSFEFIQLLLDNEANKNAKDSSGQTAYDALDNVDFSNKNLNFDEVVELVGRLKTISKDEYKKRVKENYTTALKYFKNKDYKKSAYFYEECLKYDPDNTQAMSDLSVVYYRLKQYEKALKVAKECRYSTKSSINQKASTAYNIGLICMHKDKVFCADTPFEYFLNAYKIKNSNARAKRLLSLLNNNYAKKFPVKTRYITTRDNKFEMLGIYATVYLFSKKELDDSVLIYSKEKNGDIVTSSFYDKFLLKEKKQNYYVYSFATDVSWPNMHTKICFDKNKEKCSFLNIR